jgi:CheY-like chemotaxis protein
VLVVDDEPEASEFLALTIRAMGFLVDCAHDGQAALDLAAAHPPALVLLDALLPRMDGFQVLQALRKAHPTVPVAMVSGIYKKRSYEQEAVDRLGAVAYMHKPLSVLQVWGLVERHLGVADPDLAPADMPGILFRERPLARVVAQLFQTKATGLLLVRTSGAAGMLFFEDGRIIFGRSNDPQARLDRILQSAGKLSAAGAARAKELLAAAKGKGRLGELLVKHGIIAPGDLQAALAAQQRLMVTRPFSWADGASHFFATEAPRLETFKLSFDMEGLIFWACRHLADDDALASWLPQSHHRVRLAGAADELAGTLSLSRLEAEWLQLLDGTRTVARLRAIGRIAQVDANRMLAGLQCLHRVEILNPDEVPRALRSAAAFAPPQAGEVAAVPVASVLVGLQLVRHTGTLELDLTTAAGTFRASIHLEDGLIAAATSSAPSDRLGQVLVRARLVQPDQLAGALEAARDRPQSALGRVLLDLGLVTLADLHAALVAQVQQVVTTAIVLTSGTFRLHAGPPMERDLVPLALPTLEIVLRSLRACPLADIAPRLPPPDARLARSAACLDLAPELPLLPVEDRLLLLVQRGARMQDVLANGAEAPEEVLRAAFTLMALGLVEIRGADAAWTALPAARQTSVGEVEEFGANTGEVPGEPGFELASEASFGARFDDTLDGGIHLGFGDGLSGEIDVSLEGLEDPVGSPAGPETRAAAATLVAAAAEGDELLEGFSAWVQEGMADVAPSRQDCPVAEEWSTAESRAVAAFLARLAVHLAAERISLPQSVLETLPPGLRRRYGL